MNINTIKRLISNNKLISLIIFLLSLILLLVSYSPLIHNYYPFGDDYSMIGYSKSMSLDWITKGYSSYFIAYPEWTGRPTEFIRPMVNFVYFLNYNLFGNNFNLYLISNYLISSLNATLSFLIIREIFKVHIIIALLLPFFILINPTSLLPYFASYFAQDSLSTLFALTAFYIYSKKENSYIPLFFLTLFSVYSKEVGVVFAASLSLASFFQLIIKDNKLIHLKRTIAFALPVLIYYINRLIAFKGFGNSYITSRLGSLEPQPFINKIIFWPFGFFDLTSIRILRPPLSEIGIIDLFLYHSLTLNFVVFIIILLSTIILLKKIIIDRTFNKESDSLLLIVIVNFIFLFIAILERRHGYLFNTFLIIYISTLTKVKLKITKLVSLFVICYAMYHSFFLFSIFTYNRAWVNGLVLQSSAAKGYINKILELDGKYKNIYLVNDSFILNSPTGFIKLFNIKSNIIKINSVPLGNLMNSNELLKELSKKPSSVVINQDQKNNEIKLHVSLSPIFHTVFESISDSDKFINSYDGEYLHRNKDIKYKFESLKQNNKFTCRYLLSNTFDVFINNFTHDSVIVYFDFNDFDTKSWHR